MIQVKEFLNYQNAQDTRINEWLKEHCEDIEVVDIKYSVSTFQADSENGNYAQEFSGVLIVYKVK